MLIILQISSDIKKQFEDDEQVVKILLLGASESGKSTIVKQMKLLNRVNKRTEPGFNENGKHLRSTSELKYTIIFNKSEHQISMFTSN